MSDFPVASRVRLTAERRTAQPDLADATGTVHGATLVGVELVVEVQWPRFRAWHKADALEPAP